jgi:tricorn protease
MVFHGIACCVVLTIAVCIQTFIVGTLLYVQFFMASVVVRVGAVEYLDRVAIKSSTKNFTVSRLTGMSRHSSSRLTKNFTNGGTFILFTHYIHKKNHPMKRFLLLLCLTQFSLFTSAQQTDAYFLSSPCLSPDGQTVVFSYEGDLWKALVAGGQAMRITAMPGYENQAKISPDGKWIAFTSRQSTNADVYVMSMNGGEIKQLTFHSGTDEMNNWSWNSEEIYFNSNRMGQISGYRVSAKGGTAQRVFGDYFFQYDHNLAPHPNGDIYFNDTWESSNQVQRKRYKGPFNPEIQSYNPQTKQYRKYTNWEGKDFGATIDRNGNVYFISDEANGEYNLYALQNNTKKALTRFNSSIKTPQISANGNTVVFERDYQIWKYDTRTGESSKISIQITRNQLLPRDKDYEVKGNISGMDVSPDGKKMAFISRGELFVSDVEGKFVKMIERGSAERVREVNWLADNKTLLFNQTVNGYTNWFTIAADGSAPLKAVTNDMRNNRLLSLNKNRTQAVYLSGRDELRLLDTKTFESKTIVKDEFWGFQNSSPGFSPNGEYVVFTAIRNFEQDIFVHHITKAQTIQMTPTGVTEADPTWSGDGKYLYFESQRLKPAYPFGMNAARLYRLPLEKFDEPFRQEKLRDLFQPEKKDTSKTPPPAPPIVIDTENILERMEQIGPNLGAQYVMGQLQKGDKATVLFASNHGEGRNALWKVVIEPFESNKTEKIAGTEGSGFSVFESGDKFWVIQNGNINKLNLEANKLEPVNISFTFRRNLSEEFNQIFEETWAQVEENYYDEKFHGIDWKKTKARYQDFLPHLNHRGDLRVLLNDMLGELNSSHQGFSTFGDDEIVPLFSRTMEPGILFENNDPYKVKQVVKRSPADRKQINIQPGDVLTKVNDVAVDKQTDRHKYFTQPSIDKELKLSFMRNNTEYDVWVHPQEGLFNNLYDAWIDNNQKKVDEKSKGRIAYGYMKNMGTEQLDRFIIDMTEELNGKDALILDLRYNTGGNVHDEVLRFLSQRSYLKWKYREGKLTTQSNFSPADKPIVLLINEQSLSDAEMTSQGFKALKLGKIIGNETYRWIIFTSGAGLVDNSFVRLPGWGCYSLDGKDLEMSGVQPDITVINTFEDKINGRDPQLDRAIEELLKQMK